CSITSVTITSTTLSNGSTPSINTHSSSDEFGNLSETASVVGHVAGTVNGRCKVSAKIQQILNTLKRPKRRPLPDFYIDDELDIEKAANQVDPNAPKPEGSTVPLTTSENLRVPPGLPKTLEEALYRYGTSTFKAPAYMVLDPSGKNHQSITYGKLLSRSRKVAYCLLNKIVHKGDIRIRSGDRIALVYANDDPISFVCAFYGCIMAGIVPVPIEVPPDKDDASCQQIGFLLGNCNVCYAMTSDTCKSLPRTSSGAIQTFKGWPELIWISSDNLGKPPKDWRPPPRISEDGPAYIEYTIDSSDGSMKGVTISRNAMMSHCRALSSACQYNEGECMVSVLDFKREAGLLHAVQTSILNGMHVIFVPYALMKLNPASWMLTATRFKASIAICKSRDLHWGLLATKDHKEVNLSSLRLILVADGANPWSLSSCDQFISVFLNRGLRPDAVCPCAMSPQAMTVAIRRPGRTGVISTGRGILSMSALSYGVIRVDQENSASSLTLQDCGQILPGSTAGVVRLNSSQLCKTDEVGEIILSSDATGTCYWGLHGMTNSIFRDKPVDEEGRPKCANAQQVFVRTGLLGFIGPGSLVFICGTRDGLMQVSGRRHNTDDIIATILSVEPMKFVYRGRIAVFSVKVLRDERICVFAEQRPDCSEKESFQWMSRVLQAVDGIHQVGIYCLSLVLPNQLPKTPLGGIHVSEVKRRFLDGCVHPTNVLMCPHATVNNLPKERQLTHADVGPASIMVGNIVQGVRLATASGPAICSSDNEHDLGTNNNDNDRNHQYISEILRWRALVNPDHNIYTLLNAKGTEAATINCLQLHKRAERVACMLLERGRLNTGDHVALLYAPGIELICAFYGCLYIGVVPVTIRPPHQHNLHSTLPTVKMVIDVSKAVVILSTSNIIKLLKSREACATVDLRSWIPMLETDELPKRKLSSIHRYPTPEMIAYLDFSVSTTGMLAGVKISHAAVTSLCKSMKLACELYPSRHVALAIDPYCGLGFVLWCISSVYSGHHTLLIPPSEVEQQPSLWLSAISAHKVRDTFCSYSVMELCTKGLASSINTLKQRGVNLSCVRTCVVVSEERPRIALLQSFSKLFSSLGLMPRTVTTAFGCRANIAICMQGATSPDTTKVYVDSRAIRHDRVAIVEKGAPHSLCLVESGKLLPGVRVVIANPETKGHCGDSNLGEIWVQSPHNSIGYFCTHADDTKLNEQFNQRLITACSTSAKYTYARTGFLGFLRRTNDLHGTNDDSVGHDAVFIVGSLDETIILRGLRYHPCDIENSVMRCHKKVAECAVFTWQNLLVVVVELDGDDAEALDLVPLVTNCVLEEHHLIVGVVVIVDLRVVPINSRGEKQRMHLRDRFLADQLDPIYVAYNM
ncbi:Disco-interacting protein 2, partial [Fragariocoptes setiger]